MQVVSNQLLGAGVGGFSFLAYFTRLTQWMHGCHCHKKSLNPKLYGAGTKLQY